MLFASCKTGFSDISFEKNIILNRDGVGLTKGELYSPLFTVIHSKPVFGIVSISTHFLSYYDLTNGAFLDSFDLKGFYAASGIGSSKQLYAKEFRVFGINPDSNALFVYHLDSKKIERHPVFSEEHSRYCYPITLTKHPILAHNSIYLTNVAYTDFGLSDTESMAAYFQRPCDYIINPQNESQARFTGRWPANYSKDFFDEVYARRYICGDEVYYFPKNSDSLFVFNLFHPSQYNAICLNSELNFTPIPLADVKDKYRLKKYKVEKPEIYACFNDLAGNPTFIRLLKTSQSYTNSQNNQVNENFGSHLRLQVIKNQKAYSIQDSIDTKAFYPEYACLFNDDLYFLKVDSSNSVVFSQFKLHE